VARENVPGVSLAVDDGGTDVRFEWVSHLGEANKLPVCLAHHQHHQSSPSCSHMRASLSALIDAHKVSLSAFILEAVIKRVWQTPPPIYILSLVVEWWADEKRKLNFSWLYRPTRTHISMGAQTSRVGAGKGPEGFQWTRVKLSPEASLHHTRLPSTN
jgi:hypothetical protein